MLHCVDSPWSHTLRHLSRLNADSLSVLYNHGRLMSWRFDAVIIIIIIIVLLIYKLWNIVAWLTKPERYRTCEKKSTWQKPTRPVTVVSTRGNENQECLLGVKVGQCIGLTVLPSCADCIDILGVSTSRSPKGLSKPVQLFTFTTRTEVTSFPRSFRLTFCICLIFDESYLVPSRFP